MNPEELVNEEMYVLVAPDGTPQISMLAHDFISCVAICKILGNSEAGTPLGELFEKGFEIRPVLVTIKPNGSAEDGFKRFKESIKKKSRKIYLR